MNHDGTRADHEAIHDVFRGSWGCRHHQCAGYVRFIHGLGSNSSLCQVTISCRALVKFGSLWAYSVRASAGMGRHAEVHDLEA